MKGILGCALFLVERDYLGNIKSAAAAALSVRKVSSLMSGTPCHAVDSFKSRNRIWTRPLLRKNTVEMLGLLTERYPNLSIGWIIDNALSGRADLWATSDIELARALNQLFISYTQFEAAGIKP